MHTKDWRKSTAKNIQIIVIVKSNLLFLYSIQRFIKHLMRGEGYKVDTALEVSDELLSICDVWLWLDETQFPPICKAEHLWAVTFFRGSNC